MSTPLHTIKQTARLVWQGHNDLGFHGTDQIQTPNLDALAYNGIILDRFYTQSACTPSRAALLTGQYPIRLGVQVIPMRPGEDLALPVDVSIMPEHFKQLGYKTHLVGKWHQGMSYRRNLPTQRGFDTHFGYWNGFVGYFDYVANGIFPNGTVSTTIRNVVSRSLMVLLVLGSQGIWSVRRVHTSLALSRHLRHLPLYTENSSSYWQSRHNSTFVPSCGSSSCAYW